MKNDLYKQLGDFLENQFAHQKELSEVLGGNGGSPLIPNSKLICGSINNSDLYCPGNVCDPANAGGCPGNTIGGGPGTCPLSV